MSVIQQIFAGLKVILDQGIGGIGQAADSLFQYVVLLINGDVGSNMVNGANNNTFLDSSSINATITRTGSPTQGTFTPFPVSPSTGWSASANGGSLSFSGGTDKLTLPTNAAYALTGAFTIELWYNATTNTNSQLMGTYDAVVGQQQWYVMLSTTYGLGLYYGTQGSNQHEIYLPFAQIPAIKTWNHLVIQRDSNSTWTLFLNGTAFTPTVFIQNTAFNYSVSLGAAPIYIGGGSGGFFNGFISNPRIVTGSAVYSGNFTPPSTPLTAISGTVLLLNGVNGGIIDASGKNDIFTVSTAALTNTSVYSGSNALKFNGTSDYIVVTNNNSNLVLNTSDFAFEMQVYFNSLTNSPYIWDGRTAADNLGFGLFVATTGVINLIRNNVNQIFPLTSKALVVGTWYHIAVTRKAGVWTLWINGAQAGSYYEATSTTSAVAVVGGSWNHLQLLNGFVDDVRLTKGNIRYSTSFTPATTQLSELAVNDPYVGHDLLLVRGTPSSGSDNNTIIDSSGTSTLVKTGTPYQSSANPFSANWSWTFNGTSDYASVSSTAMNLGSDDFTVECWINLPALPGVYAPVIEGRTAATATAWVFGVYNISGLPKLDYYYGGGRVTSNLNVPLGKWVHIAAVRSAGVIYLYINGVRDSVFASVSSSQNPAGPTSYIAVMTDGYYFAGSISNLRCAAGTAVYTDVSFTVPTGHLTNISGTTLLTLQNGRLINNSSTSNPLTLGGSPRALPNSPCNDYSYSPSTHGGSLLMNATSQKITTTSFTLGTGDFTIESWIYPLAYASNSFFSQGTSDVATSFLLNLQTTGAIQLYAGSASRIISTITVPLYQWSHYAVTRSGNTFTLWINGVNAGTWASSGINLSATTFQVNQGYAGPAAGFQGSITNFRVVTGAALYTTGFSLPTAPLTNVSNTKLLLLGANSVIYDNLGVNAINTIGSVSQQSSVVKYGSRALVFPGSSSIQIPYYTGVSDWHWFTQNLFTIEAWVYPTTTATTYLPIFSKHNGTTSNDWELAINTSNFLVFRSVSRTITSTVAVTTNAWNHIAMTWEAANQTLSIFLNGVQITAIQVPSGAGPANTVSPLEIGGSGSGLVGGTVTYFVGYMDDIRITKGYSRYTTTFTPPTALPYHA